MTITQQSTYRVRTHETIELRDGPGCFYCGRPLASGPGTTSGVGGFAHVHLDHVVAERNGGSSTIENLVRACHVCNTRKGQKPGWFYVLLEYLDLTGPHPPFRVDNLKGIACPDCGKLVTHFASWVASEDGEAWLLCICGKQIARHRSLRLRTSPIADSRRAIPSLPTCELCGLSGRRHQFTRPRGGVLQCKPASASECARRRLAQLEPQLQAVDAA